MVRGFPRQFLRVDLSFRLMSSDSPGGVTFVTKVVAITSVLSPQGTTSSSAADQSKGTDVVTEVIWGSLAAVDPANCTPAACRAHVEVSGDILFFPLDRGLNLGLVGLRVLLASGICTNSVSVYNL